MSDREAEVLALLGAHRTNAQIASQLYISVRTAESHVSSLLRKLDVSDRRVLAELSGELGATKSVPILQVSAPQSVNIRTSR